RVLFRSEAFKVAREGLEVVVAVIPARVHDPDRSFYFTRRVQPVAGPLGLLIIIAGDERPVAAAGKPREALVAPVVEPRCDDDARVEAFPRSGHPAPCEIVVDV